MSKKLTPNPEAIRILKDIFTKEELVEIVERLKEYRWDKDTFIRNYEHYPTADANTIEAFTVMIVFAGFRKCKIAKKAGQCYYHFDHTKLFI